MFVTKTRWPTKPELSPNSLQDLFAGPWPPPLAPSPSEFLVGSVLGAWQRLKGRRRGSWGFHSFSFLSSLPQVQD